MDENERALTQPAIDSRDSWDDALVPSESEVRKMLLPTMHECLHGIPAGHYTVVAHWRGRRQVLHHQDCPDLRPTTQGPQCCCDWGAAVSGEPPEFECADCPVHLNEGITTAPSSRYCRRHRRERRNREHDQLDAAILSLKAAVEMRRKCDAFELGIEAECPGIVAHCARGEHCNTTDAACAVSSNLDPCVVCCFCKEPRKKAFSDVS